MHVERREPQRSPTLNQAPPAPEKPSTAQHAPAPPSVHAPTAHAATADTPLARALAQAVQRRASVDVGVAADAQHPAISGGAIANVLQRTNGNAVALPQQQSVLVLYTTDHEARVRALEAELPKARGQVVTTAPTAIPGLTTIVFWGHGTSMSLCDLPPGQMVTLIKQWKKLNASLETVELITCNARHYAPGPNKAVGFTNSFANELKKGLRRGVRSSTRDITLKALPTTLWGARDAFSILLADAGTKSWVYITAPGTDDNLMQEASRLITSEKTPEGKTRSFKGDIAQRAQEVLKEAHPVRNWTMNYGYFKDLRKALNVI